MATAPLPGGVEEATPAPRARWPRALALAIAGLAALLLAMGLGLDTAPGHRLIARQVAALRPATGLRIRVGRIEGSIWGRATLRDVALYDTRGRFLAAPEIRLRWHPLAGLARRLDVDALTAPALDLARAPVLNHVRDRPLLPNFDVRVGRLAIGRMTLGRAVAGVPAVLRLRAGIDIRHRRARVALAVASDHGDRVALDLDAAPDADRFRLAARVLGPDGGVLAGALGRRGAVRAAIAGAGGWRAWAGRATAAVGTVPLADLALTARSGRYALAGRLAPSALLAGKGRRLTEPAVRVDGRATLADRRLDGTLALAAPALVLRADGAIDLARSRLAGVRVAARLRRPAALFPNMTGRDVGLTALLDGPFGGFAFRYRLAAPRVAFDATGFEEVRAEGQGLWGPRPIRPTLRLSAARVTGLGPEAGGILARVSLAGRLAIDARQVIGEGLRLTSDKLSGTLGLRLDLATGRYDLALTGGLHRYLIPGLGIVDVDSRLAAVPTADGTRALVSGRGQAAVRRFDNAFLRGLAGGLPTLTTGLVRDPDGTLRLNGLVLTAPGIRITGSGVRRRDGSFQFAGTGTQSTYGAFTLTLDGMIDHPVVRLVLARPVPALGLSAVRLDLDPVSQGFAFRAAGGSTLGPFTAGGTILTPPGDARTTITVADLAVSGTHARGALATAGQAFAGRLALAGGGIAGGIDFAPAGALQRIAPHLAFQGATLAAATPLAIRRGRLDGAILLDPAGAGIDLAGEGQGLGLGALRLARVGGALHLRGGAGTASATIAGARGRTFALTAGAQVAPARVALTLSGQVDGRPLALASPAVLAADGGGWRLAPARLTYAGGAATIAGRAGGGGPATLDLGLDALPLALLDLARPGLGLVGTASGRLAFAWHAGPPTGRADLTVRGLSRASLTLASQPIDVGLAAALSPTAAAMRATIAGGGRTIGRVQARLAPLAPGGDLWRRLADAPLFAQARYAGPAEALWRLAGTPTIDLSGGVAIGADVGGTLAAPRVRGTIRARAARLESAVTGTVIEGLRADGRFDGAQLTFDDLAGTTPGGGTVQGRATFDLGGIARRGGGVAMDVAVQARAAQLVNRDDIGATVTGPLRLRASPAGGSIAGEVTLDRGRYRLGAAAAAQVPRLAVTTRNAEEADDPAGGAGAPWTFDLRARAANRLMVRGLGLDSEWRANLTIRGSTADPAIGGQATLVQGAYQFAGRRFDLTRGTIRFSGEAPPDPILDITAGANLQGVNATIHVAGTGLRPQIAFESVPALPEDELLARLLFGTSIANLSAPEALQLATAVASLRSGGGSGGGLALDPINAVRRIARLDRLRILPADATTGQKTAVAAGKYIGRRFYVEVITDGAGYSATSTEFRVTRWLSLLSTISTIGRQSANVRVSKDY